MIDALIEAFKDRPSEKLTELFTISKKGEAVKFCKKLVLEQLDLPSMALGCGSIGYTHIPRFFDTDPDHLWTKAKKERTPENLSKMFRQLKKEQRRQFFHFFALQSDLKIWHLFFGDTTEDLGESRFIGGSHIHFVNHLWELDVDAIFDSLPERPGSSVHVKIKSEQGAAE